MFVRWESQSVEAAQDPRLPGFSEDVVVRRFDAPEALDTRFHEVRTKSAINRVPTISRVPFEWTVNPYRGCSHACAYCAGAPRRCSWRTAGRARSRISRVGDEIIGTVRDGRYRRYVRTEVLAHWMTIKPVWVVTLEDGTRLLTSGDHRFLSDRGWKHVCNSARHEPDRPHLTTNNRLLGTGRFADPPRQCADYRRGYLCGLIRGDGHLKTLQSTAGRPIRSFRLALADFEALRRAQLFLEDLDVRLPERVFAEAVRRPP